MHMSLLPHSTTAFPGKLTGRLPHFVSFEACSAFTHVSACMLAGSPEVTRYIRGFDGLVTSSAAPTASGWNDPSPGGTCTHWKSPPLHGAQFSDTTRSLVGSQILRHFLFHPPRERDNERLVGRHRTGEFPSDVRDAVVVLKRGATSAGTRDVGPGGAVIVGVLNCRRQAG